MFIGYFNVFELLFFLLLLNFLCWSFDYLILDDFDVLILKLFHLLYYFSLVLLLRCLLIPKIRIFWFLIIGANFLLFTIVFIPFIVFDHIVVSVCLWNCFGVEDIQTFLNLGKHKAAVLKVKISHVRWHFSQHFFTFFE